MFSFEISSFRAAIEDSMLFDWKSLNDLSSMSFLLLKNNTLTWALYMVGLLVL